MKKGGAFAAGLLMVLMALVMQTPSIGAHTAEEPSVTDLIAGGGNPNSAMDVGDVLVWNDLDYLYVRYETTSSGWCLVETHLQVELDWEDIPRTKKGNPIPGKFDLGDDELPCVTWADYQIERTWPPGTNLHIAAHAVVRWPTLEAFADALPDQVIVHVTFPYEGGPAYFPQVFIDGDTGLDGIYQGGCVDTDNTIVESMPYLADVFSSYDPAVAALVEYPDNLDLVNWIVNQHYVGQLSPGSHGDYTYGDVQRAIWELLEDDPEGFGLNGWSQDRVDEILAAASAYGEGFVPDCGDLIVIILEPVSGAQIIYFEYELECDFETAWGDGDEFTEGRSWATYFIYEVQGWSLEGTWILRFVYGGNWDHDLEVTDHDQEAGTFSGVGGYPWTGPPYSHPWVITGTVSGEDVDFTIVYVSSVYTVEATGTIAPGGTMGGTWSSSIGQSGAWMSIAGAAIWE